MKNWKIIECKRALLINTSLLIACFSIVSITQVPSVVGQAMSYSNIDIRATGMLEVRKEKGVEQYTFLSLNPNTKKVVEKIKLLENDQNKKFVSAAGKEPTFSKFSVIIRVNGISGSLSGTIQSFQKIDTEEKGETSSTDKKSLNANLIKACNNGETAKAKELLEQGADINTKGSTGVSPLFISCQNGHSDTVRLLLDKGATVDVMAEMGETPLMVACERGHLDIVNLLLKHHAAPNIQAKNGATALFMAAQGGHVATVDSLLKNKSDPNLTLSNGATPLMMASQKGFEGVVKLLLTAGADLNKKVGDKTALSLANLAGKKNIAQILKDAGATE